MLDTPTLHHLYWQQSRAQVAGKMPDTPSDPPLKLIPTISTLIKRAKIGYSYIFVTCVYFENGSKYFDETNSINKF